MLWSCSCWLRHRIIVLLSNFHLVCCFQYVSRAYTCTALVGTHNDDCIVLYALCHYCRSHCVLADFASTTYDSSEREYNNIQLSHRGTHIVYCLALAVHNTKFGHSPREKLKRTVFFSSLLFYCTPYTQNVCSCSYMVNRWWAKSKNEIWFEKSECVLLGKNLSGIRIMTIVHFFFSNNFLFFI